MTNPARREMPRTLQSLPFGAPIDDVVSLLPRDGAVVLRDVLNTVQLAQINAELDGPLDATRCRSLKDNVEMQQFHGYRTKRLTSVVMLSRTVREEFIANPTTLGYVKELFKDLCDSFWLQSSLE